MVFKIPEALPTHAYGYLADRKESMPLVELYLESTVDIVNETWLRPRNTFWVMQESSDNGRVFYIADYVVGIAMMERLNSVIIATKGMLFWIDVETLTAVWEMVSINEKESQSEQDI